MTIDMLKAYGANTPEGLTRCMNNEAFYLRMVRMVPGDSNFQRLYDAIGAGDLAEAFDAAHALKGSTGNLALTPIFAPVSEITELLRARTETDYTPLVTAIRDAQKKLCDICAD
mgnify:CR=1 FL=1